MLFSDITLLDETLTPREHMYLGVRDGRVAYLSDVPPEEEYGEVYHGHKKLLMPGMYNVHTHLPMTLLRGYGENMTLDDWLHKRIFPFEAKMTGEDIYWSTLLGLAELMRFGTVSASDMYYHGADMARAVLESGMKCSISATALCFDDSPLKALPVYRETVSLFRDWNGKGDGRIQVDCNIHGEYTSTPRVVADMADLAKELGARVQVHLSESEAEHQGCLQRHGKTPARYFYDLGFFDSPAVAAHCVWTTPEDWELFLEKGVTVATCPVSNLKIASGIAPAAQMLERGVSLALGTDGVASNNDHDMFQDMKILALIQKYRAWDPTAMSPRQALSAATRTGALAQGRTDCGSIALHNRADLVVLNMDAPHWEPVHDLLNTLVYSASGHDVCLTMVDGQVVYRDGEYPTLDLERIYWEVSARKDRILGELGA
ncbi:amidohydrolase [Christensenella sp. MSJ-20]|uniref:amidohydrolase family protein n=1 Tax=Christensenella sp. MSJ-20 TaxID=2841518 RepID=UPI001C756D14|nr:amidohydrolase [Christensenella sp. MSJ-20]